ncbi:MAG: DUF5132 domain-containing protein [Gammaproteobacteria bacterium]
MPRLDEVSKGVALGIGAAILIPVAIKMLAPVLKPVARSAVKNGIRAIEKGREILSETSEKMEDLVAETHAEMRAKRTVMDDDLEGVVGESSEQSGYAEDGSNVRNIVNE